MKPPLPPRQEPIIERSGKNGNSSPKEKGLDVMFGKTWWRGAFVSRSLVAFGVIFSAGVAFWYFGISPVNPSSQEQIRFVIQKGETPFEISRNLKSQGLIRSSFLFRAHAALFQKARNLKAGWYALSPSIGMNEVVAKFVAGDIIKEELVVPEGWTLRDIAKALETKGLFTQEEFFSVAGLPALDYRENPELLQPFDFSPEFGFLQEKPSFISLEGFLFPDTYQVTLGEKPHDIIRRMLANFQKRLEQELVEKIKAQDKSLFEIVTMASLLEKEVRTLEDKKLVAGILFKRLRHGMPLQVDATGVYAKGEHAGKVSIVDTQFESIYNTYTNKGLPLGPISNPGLESIIAALEPQESPYWFYLSASDGTTIFSRTFQEHKAAKLKYLNKD